MIRLGFLRTVGWTDIGKDGLAFNGKIVYNCGLSRYFRGVCTLVLWTGGGKDGTLLHGALKPGSQVSLYHI